MLEVKNAVFGYAKKKKTALEGISFQLNQGELLCILGANGVGKTTMFRTILGFCPLLGGEILVDGKDIRSISRKELAKRIAYVPQYHALPFPYRVFDVVLMCRVFPRRAGRMKKRRFRRWSAWGYGIWKTRFIQR